MEPDEAPRGARNPVLANYRVPAHLARRFHQICVGAVAEAIEPAGITPGEYAVLVAIVDLPGLDQHRLAVALGIDPVSAGQRIDRLEAMGLVDRRVHPSDRRARVLNASRRGAALRRRLKPLALAAQERIMAPLTAAERLLFLNFLTRIVESNETYARPGNGRRRPRRKGSPERRDRPD
jgi:MarR family transcriptional regulator, temperature-dependent positive regulator of motility